MSFAYCKIRFCRLFLGAMVLGPLTGCTEFQSLCTNKWLDGNWLESSAGAPVNDMVVFWDKHMRTTEDSENEGVQRPGLAGRLFLFNEGHCVEAHGRVVVKMVHMGHVEPGTAPAKLGEWSIPSADLKKLKRKDGFGDGYTLFLPWPDYHPAIRDIKVQVSYLPEKGSPRYSSWSNLTLQSGDIFGPQPRERQFAPGPLRPLTTPIVPISLPPRGD